jgi:hypothetical protein
MFIACTLLFLAVLAFYMLSTTMRHLDEDPRLNEVLELGS